MNPGRAVPVVLSTIRLAACAAMVAGLVWLLSRSLGGAPASIAAVLSGFLAGVATGNASDTFRVRVAGFFGTRVRMDIGIAMSGAILALVLPNLDFLVRPLYRAASGETPLLVLVRVGLSYVLFLLPAALVGVSLPAGVASGRGTILGAGIAAAGAVLVVVAWTRLLGFVVESVTVSVTVSVAVTVFGAGAAAQLLRRRRPHVLMLASILAVTGLAAVPHTTGAAALALVAAPAFFLGALAPGAPIAPVALGAFGGLLAGSVVLLSAVGAPATVRIGAAILGSVAVAEVLRAGSPAWRMPISAILAYILVAVNLLVPTPNARDLLGAKVPSDATLLYEREGTVGTVSVFRDPDATLLFVGPDLVASTGPAARPDYLAGYLPAFLSASPARALVIGYGSGATVRALATVPGVETIDVVEPEAAVLGASSFFAGVNDRVAEDPRVRVHFEDPRTFLLYGLDAYDLIVIRDRRAQALLDLAHDRTLPRALVCAGVAPRFPHSLVFDLGSELLYVASESPIRPDPARYGTLLADPGVTATLERARIRNAYDLFASLAGIRDDSRVAGDSNHPQLFEAIRETVFPGRDEDDVLVGLGDAISHGWSHRAAFLEALVSLARGDETRQTLEDLATRARDRQRRVARAPERLARARRDLDGGRPADAIPLLLEVLRADSRDVAANRLLGIAYRRQGDKNNARNRLEGATRIEPADYVARAELAAVLLEEGQIEGARHHLRAAIWANPEGETAWALLHDSLFQEGRKDEASILEREAYLRLPPAGAREFARKIGRRG